MTRYGIFTKPIHVEKIVNYLNLNREIEYIISTSYEEIYAYDFEIGVSYCFPRIVNVDDDVNRDRCWYNYHPAILPDYKGLLNYAIPIRDKVTECGATLHRMTMDIDGGEILCVKKINLMSPPVNTNEIGNMSHYIMF